MNLGEKIKKFRKENNLTQQDLANKLFVSRSLIAKWEQGRGMPTVDVIEKLAILMDISFEEIIGEKEIRECAIESNKVIKSHRRFSIIFMIISSFFLVAVAGLITSIYFSQRDILKPQAIYEEVESEVYVIATIENSKLIIENNREKDKFKTEIEIENSSNILVKDKFDKTIELSEIKNGSKLLVEFLYFKDKSEYNFSNKFNKITKINVIEDYIVGEEYIQGFFLSTTPYFGETVPIHFPEQGFNYEYEENGEPTFINYPYVLFRYYSTSYAIFECEKKDVYSQSITKELIKQNQVYTIQVAKRIENVYVYVIKNDNNGYFLFDTLTKEHFNTVFDAKYITDIYINTENKSHSTDLRVSLSVNFISEPTEIREYDKNNVCINTIEYGKEFFIILDDRTRYVKIKFEDGGLSTSYAPGEKILTYKVHNSGFVEDFYLAIY